MPQRILNYLNNLNNKSAILDACPEQIEVTLEQFGRKLQIRIET